MVTLLSEYLTPEKNYHRAKKDMIKFEPAPVVDNAQLTGFT
jgi:hypothetical protein